ncbi:MAG: hypothetical protein JXA92_11600 [candidate division Zixibacteria bacterium]|nr:hypothetical protein [candidate division Zixibacteria bacterium]
MKKNDCLFLIIFLAVLFVAIGSVNAQPIIAGHQAAAEFPLIPHPYIEQVKNTYKIFYGHTSHGSQIVTGMVILRDSTSLYDFNNGTGTLSLSEYGSDLGHLGDTSWVPITRQVLDQSGSDINMVMWSWCGGCSDNTEEGINIYLNALNGLEADYPDVTFIYMTGHLDGSGIDGDLYRNNNQIRVYCQTNGKILFDFADIESYDPAGTYYPDETDACNWCYDWCSTYPGCCSNSCAHSHCFNCYLKGRAFWWMMARIAGWTENPDCCEGFTGNVDCSDIENPDISDITRLIDYLYLSHNPLCCPEEADADVSGGQPDISDITRLIDFLYLSHQPLAGCP